MPTNSPQRVWSQRTKNRVREWGFRGVAVRASVVVAAGAACGLVATGVIPVSSVLHHVDQFVKSHGNEGVFGGVGIESMGIPFPGETTLISVGAVLGNAHRAAPIPWLELWGSAAAGGIVGDNIGYWAGRVGGKAFLRRVARSEKSQTKLKVGRYLFDKYGGPVVGVGRFTPILRTYAAMLAGVNQMKFRKFFVWNAAGAIAWSGIYSSAAYFAAGSFRHLPHPVTYGLAGVGVAGTVVSSVIIKRKFSKLETKANEAFPGSPWEDKGPHLKPRQLLEK